MKVFLAAMFLATCFLPASAQKYFTRDGKVSFTSDAPLEKIEAVNQKVASVLDAGSGNLEFAVLVKSFQFEKALMEEHFNENYLESGKYPKASFKGTVTNLDDIDFSKSGKYRAVVAGELEIHGVTKAVEVEATFAVGTGSVHASSVFEIAVADYNIEVPKVVRDNVAKVVQIHVDIDYKPLEQ
jgi:polyisoprenoid-binding protein YceI